MSHEPKGNYLFGDGDRVLVTMLLGNVLTRLSRYLLWDLLGDIIAIFLGYLLAFFLWDLLWNVFAGLLWHFLTACFGDLFGNLPKKRTIYV